MMLRIRNLISSLIQHYLELVRIQMTLERYMPWLDMQKKEKYSLHVHLYWIYWMYILHFQFFGFAIDLFMIYYLEEDKASSTP